MAANRAPQYSAAEVIEATSWFYIPWGWIGCLGWIVEKDEGTIFKLGSGLGGIDKAIDAYQEGTLEPFTPSADLPAASRSD